MALTLDDVATKFAALVAADDGLIAVAKQIADALRANASDPTKVQALADAIDAEVAKVTQATADDTPA